MSFSNFSLTSDSSLLAAGEIAFCSISVDEAATAAVALALSPAAGEAVAVDDPLTSPLMTLLDDDDGLALDEALGPAALACMA